MREWKHVLYIDDMAHTIFVNEINFLLQKNTFESVQDSVSLQASCNVV